MFIKTYQIFIAIVIIMTVSIGSTHSYSLDYRFMKSCMDGDLEKSQWIYDLGHRINKPIDFKFFGEQTFHWSVVSGHKPIIKWLVELMSSNHDSFDIPLLFINMKHHSRYYENDSDQNHDFIQWFEDLILQNSPNGYIFNGNLFLKNLNALFLWHMENDRFEMAKKMFDSNKKFINPKELIEQRLEAALSHGNFQKITQLVSFANDSNTVINYQQMIDKVFTENKIRDLENAQRIINWGIEKGYFVITSPIIHRAFYLICLNGNLEDARVWKKIADINAYNIDIYSYTHFLYTAGTTGNWVILEFLLKLFPEKTDTDLLRYNDLPLEMIKLVVELTQSNGKPININDEFGKKLVLHHCKIGRLDAVQYFIDYANETGNPIDINFLNGEVFKTSYINHQIDITKFLFEYSKKIGRRIDTSTLMEAMDYLISDSTEINIFRWLDTITNKTYKIEKTPPPRPWY